MVKIIQQIRGKGPTRSQYLDESTISQQVWLRLDNSFLLQVGITWITIRTKNVLGEILVKRICKLGLIVGVTLELESIESEHRVLI